MDNQETICYFVMFIIFVILIIMFKKNRKNSYNSSSKGGIVFQNDSVQDKYKQLVSYLGKPTLVESCCQEYSYSVTWMTRLENFNGYGKIFGLDMVKLYGYPKMKWHPHPAPVYVQAGKFLNVPEHLFGPLKYASETINIEQVMIPESLSQKYGQTGVKSVSLVTGSCASVTISAVTIHFVENMIAKYGHNLSVNPLELYQEFRETYDQYIGNYLCGRGVVPKIPWFSPKDFGEPEVFKASQPFEFCNEPFIVGGKPPKINQ